MFAYCENNPVNYLDPTGTNGVYFADATIYALSGALAGLIAGISSIKASIEAALAAVSVPVICIAAVAVAVTAVICLIDAMQELSAMAEEVVAWTKAQVLKKSIPKVSYLVTLYMP